MRPGSMRCVASTEDYSEAREKRLLTMPRQNYNGKMDSDPNGTYLSSANPANAGMAKIRMRRLSKHHSTLTADSNGVAQLWWLDASLR